MIPLLSNQLVIFPSNCALLTGVKLRIDKVIKLYHKVTPDLNSASTITLIWSQNDCLDNGWKNEIKLKKGISQPWNKAVVFIRHEWLNWKAANQWKKRQKLMKEIVGWIVGKKTEITLNFLRLKLNKSTSTNLELTSCCSFSEKLILIAC